MSDLRVQLIIDAQNNSSSVMTDVRNDVRGLDNQLGGLERRFNQFLALKAAEMITGWGMEIIRTADGYQTLTAKLAMVTDSYKEQMAVQKELFDISQRSHANLSRTEDAYIKNADAIRLLGGSTEQALQVTETLNKAIATTSQGFEQDRAAINQWSQALGKGILNGDELTSIMENSFGLMKAIADGMGVPTGKLKELGEQGKLTATDLINALIKEKDHIDETFNSIPVTVQQSLTMIDNAWTKFIGETNKATGATQALANGFVEVSEHLPELINASLELAAIYGIKLAAGVAGYVDAQLTVAASSRAVVAAAEQETIVNLELLRVQTEVAAMRVNAARHMAEVATVQLALVATVPPMIAAEQRFAGAEVEAARISEATTQQRLTLAQQKVAAALRTVAATNGEAAAVTELNAAMAALVVVEGEATAAASTLATAETRLTAATEATVAAREQIIATSGEAAAAQEALAKATRDLAIAENAATESSRAYRNARGAELARIESENAAARLTTARATQVQAEAQLRLATTSAETAVAQRQLAAAIRGVGIAEREAAAASRIYQEQLAAMNAQTTAAARSAELLGKAFNLAFAGWVGWEVGTFIGEWLNQFELFRNIGIQFAQGLTELEVKFKHFFSGDFLSFSGESLTNKLLDVERGYDEIRKASTNEAVAASEQAKRQVEALKAIEIARKTNLKELQTQLKETTALVESEYTRQNNAIKQLLEQRKTEMMTSVVPEIMKEVLISKAVAEANAARLLTIQQAGDKKLELIGHVYDAELARLKAGTVEQKTVEKQSIEERIAVYANLEKSYQGIIGELIADEQRHAQASAALLTERETLERDTQTIIRTIRQGGMTDEQLLADKKKQLDENLSAERKALLEGDTKDARIYGEQAAKIAQELATQAVAAAKAGTGYSSDADNFIKKLEEARGGIVKAVDKENEAHISQQKQLADSIGDTQTKLNDAKSKIGELTTALQQKFLLKIDVDSAWVDAVINRIKLPTESTHTIHVIEDRSGINPIRRDGSTFTNLPEDAPEGHQNGGPIQAFANGGWPRVQGQLPGYGGGDRVRALLEDGEFVLRKEAVAANGSQTIQALNDGRLQLSVKRFNSGGQVSNHEEDGGTGYSSAGSFDVGSPTDSIDALLAKMDALKKQQSSDRKMEEALGLNFWPNLQAQQAGERIYQSAERIINANLEKAKDTEALKVREQLAADFKNKMDEQNAKYLHPSLDAMFPLAAQPQQTLVPNVPEFKQGSQLLASTGRSSGAVSKTVILRFESPDGHQAASGSFAEADAKNMMDILKASGMRTTGGTF